MNPTIKLLRTIGSPFAPATEEPQHDEEAQELYTLAVQNKMQLLYLEALKGQDKLGQLKPKYDELQAKYYEFLSTVTQASKLLNLKEIEHVVQFYLNDEIENALKKYSDKYMKFLEIFTNETKRKIRRFQLLAAIIIIVFIILHFFF